MPPNPLKAIIAFGITMLLCLYGNAQTTGYSGTGANIDVTYHRCNWHIDPNAAKNIAGSVTTYFVTKVASVSQIKFDLNKASFDNGSLDVTYHGSSIAYSFPTTGNVNIITITLPAALPINTFDSVTITYSGTPPPINTEAIGYQKTGTNVSTLSESYEDRDWWPCKADMQDKIDSMDFYVRVPNGFRVAAPGKFMDSSLVGGGDRVFYWKSRYPIASYLVALGISQYRVYDRGTVNINGTLVPVMYFIYSGKTAATYTSMLNALDVSKTELTVFSNLFGDYPFKNEKHGFYEYHLGGGMEHQTFSAMSGSALSSPGTIAHELMHQWFGDKVTFSTWRDLWLAEGFAKYGEVLAAEFVPAFGGNPVSMRSGIKSTAIGNTSTAVRLTAASITNSNGIWTGTNNSAVYQRGAMVVSTLRALVGDTRFFQACRNYLNDPLLAYKSASSDDLKRHFENITGHDLDPFFDNWVYRNGNPDYTINWGYNSINKNIRFRVVTQTRSAGSSSTYFPTPLVLRIQGGANDTTVVVYDDNAFMYHAGNGISGGYPRATGIAVPLSFVPTTVTFDPFHQTMATGTVNQLASLAIEIEDFHAKKVVTGNEITLKLSDAKTVQQVVLQKSINGADFSNTGNMNRTTWDGYAATYIYTDENINGTTWYRARIIGEDKELLSKIISVQDNRASSVRISPNPADKEIVVSWKNNSNNNIVQIVNTEGRIIAQRKANGTSVKINITDLAQGVYVVQLIQQGVVITKQRIVIQR